MVLVVMVAAVVVVVVVLVVMVVGVVVVVVRGRDHGPKTCTKSRHKYRESMRDRYETLADRRPCADVIVAPPPPPAPTRTDLRADLLALLESHSRSASASR